jgi:hypothetical protein
MELRIVSGKKSDKIKKGISVRQENNIETKITGITALSFRETFLKTSYEPSKIAEIKARNNHIRCLITHN